MSREIKYEHTLRRMPDGSKALYILPAIPDDAPDLIREGIARRRIAALTGKCPCGTTDAALTRQQRRARERARGKVNRLAVHHEPDCPAGDQILVPLLQRWIDAGTDPPGAA